MPLSLLAEVARKTNDDCTITVSVAVGRELLLCMIGMFRLCIRKTRRYIVILLGEAWWNQRVERRDRKSVV